MFRIVKVIAEGVLWSGIGIALLWMTLPDDLNRRPPNFGGLLDNDFAQRWDGTCTGWTKSLATFHVVGDLLLWTAYTVVALVMWRLHPILKRVPTARITVPLICTAFLTCGAVHLFSAYVVFNPIYLFDGVYKTFAGIIGWLGAVYIAHDLVTIFDVIEKEHDRLETLESQQPGPLPTAPAALSPEGKGLDERKATVVKRSPLGRIVRAVAEGILWSLLGLLLLWLPTMEPITAGFFRNDFASQWSGACTGWTKPLAVLHIIGSLITWSAYVLIGIVVLRLHPIARRVRLARIMVPVVSVVIITCGAVHLLDAYAVLNPIFVVLGWFKIIVAVVSLAGAVLVSQTLVMVFDVVEKEQRRLQELESM